MIKEFAIDPELFCQWAHHLVLRSEFGADKGRLIVDFPKKWKRMLAEATDKLEANGGLPPVKAQTVRNWISKFGGQTDLRFVRRAWPYDGNRSWRSNVEDQASQFDVVLSHQGITAENVLIADDEHRYLANPWFTATTQTRLRREKKAIVDTVWPLVRASSGIIKIVEPNFNPVEPRFMQTFVELIDRLSTTTIREIELHVLRPDMFSQNTLQNFRTHIDRELRSGYQVRVYFWGHKVEQLHDRYLLTNLGGMELSFGWDEGRLPNETTVAKMLSPSIWEQEWKRYCPGCPDFDLDEQKHILQIPG